jgi:hypothetical protein
MAEKTLNECVDDAYRALKMAHDKFIADKEYWGGNHHFEWVSSVGMTGIISFNKQYMKYGTYTPLTIPKDEPKQSTSAPSNKVTVRLTDGSVKTVDVKTRLRELGWWWNKPEKSYDWNKEMDEADWEALKKEEPFCKLTAKIVRG